MEIPQFGFGVFQVPPDETAQTVRAAFDAGYRHIDTAQMYGNEEGVGQALAESGLSRDEVFLTTKLQQRRPRLRHGDPAAGREPEAARHRPRRPLPDPLAAAPGRPLRRHLARVREGRRRGQGARDRRLQLHRREPRTARGGDRDVPAVNQVELHPRFTQDELRAYHAQHGIATEAWSPIGQGQGLLDDPLLGELAGKYGKSPAQVVLRWHVQLGNIVFPKSMHPERMRENIDVFDFELADDDVAAISGLNVDGRLGPDPDRFG